eukprot:CAMPEP_0195518220 /NCGR_PEP_ID=MMETSP0794_2-20130614/12597_1 /TAXON_ID=515487 /ORGANISM="Stephanopyxis turris, Strain CCMP 815" /LENGTH=251 /DNA_ID=CAMNT_0040647153 /DNA_START=94 /DNA_END=849 /DNA_ORIENTATION=+
MRYSNSSNLLLIGVVCVLASSSSSCISAFTFKHHHHSPSTITTTTSHHRCSSGSSHGRLYASNNTPAREDIPSSCAKHLSRRDAAREFSVAVGGCFAATVFGVAIPPVVDVANASGGATAGGAYLLSAKQRYNERVISGIQSFLALSSSLESGDLGPTKVFLSSEEVGYWSDLGSAGYLLANAFRTSSSKPPDTLPSVQKWKAFKANVDAMEKALKNKKKGDVVSFYKKGEELLDAYLESVELPPVIEMRQ